jgi:hypothetical protein
VNRRFSPGVTVLQRLDAVMVLALSGGLALATVLGAFEPGAPRWLAWGLCWLLALGLGLEARGVVGESQRRPPLQLDVDRFVYGEQRAMPAWPALMQARLKHQPVARRGAIHNGLRIVAGPDRMLGGGEHPRAGGKQPRAGEEQPEGVRDVAGGNHRWAISWTIGQGLISLVTRGANIRRL